MTDDNTLERVAIAGATAIQHIIAERMTFVIARMFNSRN